MRHVLTILAVEDMARSIAFYERGFGWRRIVDAPVYVELEVPGGMRLGLYERRGFGRNTGQEPAPTPQGAIAPTELYFHTDPDELDAAIERITGAGARLLSARAARDWGDEAAYFADPDGNVIVLACPIDAGEPALPVELERDGQADPRGPRADADVRGLVRGGGAARGRRAADRPDPLHVEEPGRGQVHAEPVRGPGLRLSSSP